MAKKMNPEGSQLWPSYPASYIGCPLSFPPCSEALRSQDCKPGMGVCAVEPLTLKALMGAVFTIARRLSPVPAICPQVSSRLLFLVSPAAVSSVTVFV